MTLNGVMEGNCLGLGRYPTKFVMWDGGGVPDVVNHDTFHQNRFRGFGSPREVEIRHFPMLNAMAYKATGNSRSR